MDKLNLLIDFSSPAHKNNLALPLIPVPPQTLLAPKEIDEQSDPFEVQQVEAPDPFEVPQVEADPFDCALRLVPNSSNSEQTAVKELDVSTDNNIEQIQRFTNCVDSNDYLKTSKVENVENQVEPALSSSPEKEPNERFVDNNETSCKNEIPNHVRVDFENSPNINIIQNSAQDFLKNSSKSLINIESDSKSHKSADFSTDDSLKAVIAKRVNRCIQDVLNGSVKTDTNVDKSMLKITQNKRSLSFIGLSSAANKECDRLNKSCTDAIDTTNLENQLLDSSNDTSGVGPLSANSTDLSTESKVEDKVFKEAHKLSRTFSKLAESFRRDQESESDGEDLISCKPRWYADSSEDEEEKLRKDPTLNLRRRSDGVTCSSPAPTPPRVTDSPALLAYKSRRSLTHVQTGLDNTQEEVTMKRSISMGSQLKEISIIPPLVSSGPINLMKIEVQPIRLRKKFGGETKKGPLRAVMPVQSMTKEPFAITGKRPSKQDNTSPETRIQRSAHVMRTPVKDNSQLNITPMASSTPNKAESFADSKLSDSLLIKSSASNKRHSLEGNLGSHQSRAVLPDAGMRPRSNSASSSIPRVMQIKPLRGLPLAPKSTSSLARGTATQMNANKVPEKKKASLKSTINSRVLTDVKTKSPRQSKVKAAVSTLSNLVKGKKTAFRDKENRVPV